MFSLRSIVTPSSDPAVCLLALLSGLLVALGCASTEPVTEHDDDGEQSEYAESPDRNAQLRDLAPSGVYAPCRAYTATAEEHYRAGRAARTASGGTYTYVARGSEAELTGTVTLVESARAFFEPGSSCALPKDCQLSELQPPTGLSMRCSINASCQGARHFDVHVPNSYANTSPVPLVIELHGGGGAAVPPLTEYVSGRREVSDTSAEPFIAAWPVGSHEANGPAGEEWQTCNYDDSTREKPCPAPGYPNDRTFVIEVVKKLVDDLKIDTRKIYATGLSSGAAMVHTLACKYSEYFAAVAPMATGMVVQQQPRARDRFDLTIHCEPTRELPIFYAHSPHDQTASFEEGAAAVNFWRQKYGCSQEQTETYRSELDALDATDAQYPAAFDLTTCKTTTCGPPDDAAASAVTFCEVDGSSNPLSASGHVIWLGDDLFFPAVQPQGPRLAQWAWDWMRAYALPAEPPWPPPI